MSKRHQASRRRSYGRRQHELHEVRERGDIRRETLDGAAPDGSFDGMVARASADRTALPFGFGYAD